MDKATIEIRKNRLKKMDIYVINTIGDEEETAFWLQMGVPDCATEDDFQFIAENEEEYNRCCRVFAAIVVDSDKVAD